MTSGEWIVRGAGARVRDWCACGVGERAGGGRWVGVGYMGGWGLGIGDWEREGWRMKRFGSSYRIPLSYLTVRNTARCMVGTSTRRVVVCVRCVPLVLKGRVVKGPLQEAVGEDC